MNCKHPHLVFLRRWTTKFLATGLLVVLISMGQDSTAVADGNHSCNGTGETLIDVRADDYACGRTIDDVKREIEENRRKREAGKPESPPSGWRLSRDPVTITEWSTGNGLATTNAYSDTEDVHIAVDRSGDIYVATNVFRMSKESYLPVAVLLQRYDRDWNPKGSVKIQRALTTVAMGLVAHPREGVLLCGTEMVAATPHRPTRGFIIHVSPKGRASTLFVRKGNADEHVAFVDMVIDEQATITALGLHNTRALGQSEARPFVVRLSRNGRTQWASELRGVQDPIPRAIAVDPKTNEAYIAMESSLRSLEAGAWVVKLSAKGRQAWVREVPKDVVGGKQQWRHPRAITVGPKGGVYVAGDSPQARDTLGGVKIPPRQASNVFVSRLTTAGQLSWTRSIESPFASRCYDAAFDANGLLLIAGYCQPREAGRAHAPALFGVRDSGDEAFTHTIRKTARDRANWASSMHIVSPNHVLLVGPGVTGDRRYSVGYELTEAP